MGAVSNQPSPDTQCLISDVPARGGALLSRHLSAKKPFSPTETILQGVRRLSDRVAGRADRDLSTRVEERAHQLFDLERPYRRARVRGTVSGPAGDLLAYRAGVRRVKFHAAAARFDALPVRQR